MRILVLEPEPYTGLATQWEIRGEGHEVIGPVARLREVLPLCRAHRPELALIDVDEYDAGAVSTVLRELTSNLGVRVVLVTSNPKLTSELRQYAIGVLSKPFAVEHISGALAVAHEILSGGRPPPPEIPPSLTLGG